MHALHEAGLLLLIILAVGACRSPMPDRNGDGKVVVLCIGDSNTDPGFTPKEPSWCDLMGEAYPKWQTINGAVIAAQAGGDCVLCGQMLMESGLEYANPDLVFIALGTNDLLSFNKPPDAVVSSLLALRDQAAAAKADVFIATVPPLFKGTAEGKAEVNVRIKATNALLAQRVTANHLVDFSSDMDAEDFYPDGIHVNLAGQQKRAAAALRCLKWL